MSVRLTLALLLIIPLGIAQDTKPVARPHIVVFLADDLGWKDVGYHGSEIKTPHIDRIAASGVQLDQFYVQPVCSPTRAAFLTGRYPIRLGLQFHVIRPWAQYGLDLDERTLPQALKSVGYTTAIVGKWHLGTPTPEHLPTARGFDHQYGHYLGMLDYFTHRRDGGKDWNRNDKPLDEKGYTTNLIRKESVRLISEHDADNPLFLYVAFNAPHTPLQVPPRWIKQYQGIEKTNRRKFAGMVSCMDDAIGKIVSALDNKGMSDDTLFVFSSDNGGPRGRRGAGDNGALRAGKGTLYEGGVRVPAFASWKGRLPSGNTVSTPLHIVDLHATLLEVAGVTEKAPKPLDGRSAWGTLVEGAPSPRSEILLNHTTRRSAVRVGDWKLVVTRPQRAPSPRHELFDLSADPNEERNLATEKPEKLAELLARVAHYASVAAPQRDSSKAPNGWKTPRNWGHPDPKK